MISVSWCWGSNSSEEPASSSYFTSPLHHFTFALAVAVPKAVLLEKRSQPVKYAFYFVQLCLLFCAVSCQGQVESSAEEQHAAPAQPAIKITGEHQNSVLANHNPYNDVGLVSQYVRSIFQDSKGQYWFASAGQNVCRFDGQTLHYFGKEAFFAGNTKVGDEFSSVHAIAEDGEGHLWFGTDFGLVKYDGHAFSSYTEEHGLSNIVVGRKSILIDESGTLWVGTQAGVFRYNPAADKLGKPCFNPFELLPQIKVKDIMEDQSGNVWFAAQDRGLFRYDGASILNLNEIQGLGDSYAGGMAEDDDGNYWFTMEGGICRYDGETFTTFTTADGIGGSEVWGIYREKSGIIWITARGSTTRFDPSLEGPEVFTVYTVEDGLNCCVQSMYQDQAGRMWWGTGQGLYRFDGERFFQVKQQGPW